MGCEVGIRPVSSKESIKTAYLHLTTIGKHQVTEDGVCDGLNGHWDDGGCVAVAKYGRLNCPQTEEKRKKKGRHDSASPVMPHQSHQNRNRLVPQSEQSEHLRC